MSFLSKIFGDANQRYIDSLKPTISRINSLENDFEQLSDSGLKEKTIQFRERLSQGETLDDLLPEAFAAVREASKRALGQRHFDVQLMGGMALHQGKISEMKTGEGKTLVATLPAYLNALAEARILLRSTIIFPGEIRRGWDRYITLSDYRSVASTTTQVFYMTLCIAKRYMN